MMKHVDDIDSARLAHAKELGELRQLEQAFVEAETRLETTQKNLEVFRSQMEAIENRMQELATKINLPSLSPARFKDWVERRGLAAGAKRSQEKLAQQHRDILHQARQLHGALLPLLPLESPSFDAALAAARRLAEKERDHIDKAHAAHEDILPDRLDSEGLPPIWQTRLSDNAAIAEWLTQRIHEIDRMVQKATTIAVLVNEEEQVEPLALELNDRLEEINLSAVACKDGKVVGNDRDVRVFNIQHIKGLEFEAVFFVDLDKTIAQHPDLFSKYLYVGATRAATYLGVTFHGDIPEKIEPLSHHFGQDWSL